MNIAILSYEYPPDTGFGGIGTYSYYQARGLARLGHRVHVIAGSLEDGIHHHEHDGVQVTRIKHEGWTHRLLGGARDARCWWFANRLQTAFSAYTALHKVLDKEHIDIVEMPECGGDGILVTTQMQIPTAIKFHSPARLIMNIYDTPKMDRELTAFAEQIAINQATVHTSCSRFLADEVREKMGVGAPIHIIPNGIDVQLFDSEAGIDVVKKFKLPKDPKAITIFFANRIEERKGIHIVKEAARQILKRYPHVHFAIAGNDLFGYMKNDILPDLRRDKVHKRFHYLGQLDLPHVRAMLKFADIFMIPSLWENCPYSCIEAMTAGRAIVSSDCGGMPELIEDRSNGLLALNDDAEAFVRALSEMIEDADLRDRCGAAARQFVEQRLTDVKIADLAVRTYSAALAD